MIASPRSFCFFVLFFRCFSPVLFFRLPATAAERVLGALVWLDFPFEKVPSIRFSARFPNHFYLNTKCVAFCVCYFDQTPMTNKIVDQKFCLKNKQKENRQIGFCILTDPLIRPRRRGKEDTQSVLGS
jgi:hypothetical protein